MRVPVGHVIGAGIAGIVALAALNLLIDRIFELIKLFAVATTPEIGPKRPLH